MLDCLSDDIALERPEVDVDLWFLMGNTLNRVARRNTTLRHHGPSPIGQVELVVAMEWLDTILC